MVESLEHDGNTYNVAEVYRRVWNNQKITIHIPFCRVANDMLRIIQKSQILCSKIFDRTIQRTIWETSLRYWYVNIKLCMNNCKVLKVFIKSKVIRCFCVKAKMIISLTSERMVGLINMTINKY